MIFNLNDLEPGGVPGGHDCCIIGAGVAGITLAVDLANKGIRVLLLEAGSLQYEACSQSVYQGENTGRSYFKLEAARLRYFGGTSNHWTGWCRPLDRYDFEVRDHTQVVFYCLFHDVPE